MHSFETLQGTNRHRHRSVHVFDVELHDLIACDSSVVRHCDTNRQIFSSLCRSRDPESPISKPGIAQSVAKRKKRLTAKVAIGPARHSVILKSRQLIYGFIE